MSDSKTTKRFQEEKRIEIKPFSEIRNNAIKNPVSEGFDNTESDDLENVRSAKQKLLQMNERKEKMLEETRSIITKEKDEWEQTKNLLIKEAHYEGYEAGFSTGKQDGLDQYQDLLHKANQIAESEIGRAHV